MRTVAVFACVASCALAGSHAGFSRIPVYFEENQGQFGHGPGFAAHAGSATVYLSGDSASTLLGGRVVSARYAGASGRLAGLDRQRGVSNYYIGNDPTRWRTLVPHYGRVEVKDAYPGIDIVYYSESPQSSNSLEYDFVVRPGADPGKIAVDFEGADTLELTASGDLRLRVPAGEILHRRPVAYQTDSGSRVPVRAAYRLHGKRVTIDLGDFRRDLPLVIDPIVDFSTYQGGSGSDATASVSSDGTSAFVAGTSSSTAFPPGSLLGTSDLFAAKFTAAGNALEWITRVGGSAEEIGRAIAYSAAGSSVYVGGTTQSTNLPATAGSFRPSKSTFDDAFVTQLNPATGAIVKSTYYGGTGQDFGFGLAINTAGGPILVGQTGSTDIPLQFPVDSTLGGLEDGFIASFDVNLGVLAFSTYLGGSSSDEIRAAAVSGNTLLVGGVTGGGLTTFAPLKATYGGGASDGMFARYTLPTRSLLSASYFGGSATDEINGVAMDSAGRTYLTGRTTSSDFPHTSVSAVDRTYNGGGDSFLVKLQAGNSLIYGTLIGGSGDDNALSVAVDSVSGNAVIAGATSSADFRTYNANQPAIKGVRDAFVAKFNSTAAALIYSTFFGGTGTETAQSVALDSTGTVAFIAGSTDSTNFPVVNAVDPTVNGGGDGFVARFSDGPPPVIVTFAANPSGRSVLVDGASYPTPVTLGWATGVTHTVSVDDPQFQPPDQAFSWTSWDAPLTTNAKTQQVVTPGAPVTYTANFQTQTCTYSVDPATATVPLTGGLATFNVATQGTCPWKGTPEATWLSGGGSVLHGSGSVSFTAQSTAFARTGTANVAFEQVTVSQAVSQTPVVQAPNPAFGTGSSQTFTFQFDDPNGASDLAVLNVLVNDFIDGRVACYLAYVPSGPSTGALFLVNDTGDAGGPFAGNLPIPSSNTISNSQCTINGAGSSATMNGNRLTLVLNMSFTGALAGNRIIYQAARDMAANNSGWVAKGVWKVPGAAPFSPSVVSLTPARSTSSSATLSVVVSDTDGFADVNIINILINNFIDGRVACYLAFVRSSGQLFLVNDAGDAGGPFAGGIVIPGSGTVGNSQCTINGTGSSVTGQGSNVTLNLNMNFSPSFQGDRIVWVAVRDVAEHNSGWQAVGTVSVP
ncbi:MAG: SBBP repeat-containing protein [Bryobacteraceae bacterium]